MRHAWEGRDGRASVAHIAGAGISTLGRGQQPAWSRGPRRASRATSSRRCSSSGCQTRGTSTTPPPSAHLLCYSYFRHGNSARKFAVIDSYVRERLAILVSLWPAPHTDTVAATGPADTPTPGSASASTASAATSAARPLRMPRDERCPRAVCGRTVRVVRQGAAGEAAPTARRDTCTHRGNAVD